MIIAIMLRVLYCALLCALAVDSQSTSFLNTDGDVSALSLTYRIAAGCSLIWPRMGEEYVYPQEVFVQYMCELRGLERDELVELFGIEETLVGPDDSTLVHNTMPRNISVRVRAYTVDVSDTIFAVAYERVLPYPHRVGSSGVLCDSFMLDLEDVSRGARRRWGSMRVEVQLLLDGRPLSKANAVVFVQNAAYFDRAAAIASSPSPSSTAEVDAIRCDYSAELRRCLPGSSVLSPRQYDFIEIGTSGFSTVLELAAGGNNATGLSVEILKELQDTLPDVPGVVKVNAGIADEAGWRDLYHIPKRNMERIGSYIDGDQPFHNLYGMSMVGNFKTYLERNTRRDGLGDNFAFHPITHRQMVSMKHAGQLLAEYGAASVLYLKIDCEGFDYRIMHAVLDYYDTNRDTTQFPLMINYEDNFDPKENAAVISRLMQLGYRVYHIRYDVAEPIHDSIHGGVFGEVYAELAVADPERTEALLSKAHLVALEAFQAKNSCLKYHMARGYLAMNTTEGDLKAKELLESTFIPEPYAEADVVDSTGKPLVYYCNFLVSYKRQVLSVNHNYIVY